MIGTNKLIDELNDLIDGGGLDKLELIQAFGAIESLEKNGVNIVGLSSELPDALLNQGRFFYVLETNEYVMSDGSSWSNENIISAATAPNVWSWGNSGSGRLGDGTTTNRSSPVSVVSGFTDWIQISAGTAHSLAVRANGTAWSWGLNTFGRLGDGTEIDRSSPVSVVSGFTDWIQISAGTAHSLGVRANGTAWSWGLNTFGRLGDGTTTQRTSPVSVVGGFTDWIQLSAGNLHSLGLRADGSIWAWGINANGRLGDGTTTSRTSPVSVVGGFTDWIQLSAGDAHSLGVRANGTAWSWGFNGNGRLGDNTTTNRFSPVSVVGEFTDWISVDAGNAHSLAVRANGTAWAWGLNTNGQLGNNTTTSQRSPVSVIGGFTDWISVSAGGTQSAAIRAT